jgi:GMP synthase (glutamine-hydrolysing)
MIWSRAMPSSSPDHRRALLLQHERETPAGLIGQWLDERGVDIDVQRIDLDDRDLDPREYQLIVSLGSEAAAYDDSLAFISKEQKLLRQAIAASVPVLGICFGAQLLARTLGGGVSRAPVPEIGWVSVRTHDHALVEEGPWFQWHFDTFTTPPGSTLLAESDAGPQAYVVGRNLGVQFHPEVTPEIIDGWMTASRHELDSRGLDPDAMRREAIQRADENRQATWRLLARYTEFVARLGWGDHSTPSR